MKNITKFSTIAISCLLIALILASCKIEEPDQITIVKPLSVADKEFLNEYDALKTYVNRSVNQNFRLGAGISMTDITDKGVMNRLLSSNFDQITPVSGMFHGSVMAADGSFDFSSGIPAFLTTSGEARLTVFGPALVWHAEQRAAYLNSLLADDRTEEMVWVPGEGGSTHGEKIINGDFADDNWSDSFLVQNGGTTGAVSADGQGPNGTGRALMVVNPAVQANGWGSQMIIKWDTPMLTGEEWTFRMDYKSDEACEYGNQAQAGPGNYMHNGLVPEISSTTSWQTLENTFTVEARSNNCTAIAFDLGFTATTYYFANLSLYKHPVTEKIEMLENGDFEESDDWSASFLVQNGGTTGAVTADGQGSGGQGRALMVVNPAVQANGWGSQMIIKWDTPMLTGEEWIFRMDYKSDEACEYGNQAQAGPGNYMHNGLVPEISSTTSWQTLEKTFTVEARSNNCTAIAFDLGFTATAYYFDNVSLVRIQVGGPEGKWEEVVTITPKTPEQKTGIVVGELERWLEGMMDAAGEYVKDWTVINEPMDDNQPSQVRTSPESPGANDFYWQDYLRGKDYARTVVGFTRLYGGQGLRLFVNETGLINKAKCEGLIQMIQYWEQDGTTRIDGIGAQMNLTCSSDPATQAQNKANVEEMFTLLAATGKLIRISALDMRIATAGGALIPAAEVTREHQMEMSKYYNFIIRRYFEIIPAEQRYGITVHPKESATNAGLWDGSNSRKFTFSGFADGLAGQDVKHD